MFYFYRKTTPEIMISLSTLAFKNARKLVPGSTIGIIAPSAGNAQFFPHRVEQGERFLKQLGYKVKFATHALENRDYVSADPEKRAADIHELFLDPDVSAILCTIGGNHSNQLLEHLDYDLIKKNPKIFVGYSDITVLHYAFAAKAGLRTFYGPCLMTQFGEYPAPLPFTLDSFSRALADSIPMGNIEASKEWTTEILDWRKKKDLERPRILTPSLGYRWLREGKAEGKIFGGCVPSLNHLAGTEYWVDPAKGIFFVDIPEGHQFGEGLSIAELDSFLADLENLGVFSHIAGLVVGRPYNYSPEQEKELGRLLLHYTRSTDYPILLNVNIGHADPIITLPLGVRAALDSQMNTFSLEESGVV